MDVEIVSYICGCICIHYVYVYVCVYTIAIVLKWIDSVAMAV